VFKVGLTGGIGSGKTAASDIFETLGIVVVDADIVAREVVEPGEPALDAIQSHFGQDVILASGELNRARLREIIFSALKHKQWLEALLHPLIRERIIQQLNQAESPYCILSSPLLFETDQHMLVDTTLLIDVPEAIQLQRASKRDGTSPNQIQAIIEQQMDRDSKRQHADAIITNDQDMSALKTHVIHMHQRYLEQLNER